MGVISTSTLPFLPETHVFSTLFKLLQANSTLFKHLWLVTLGMSLPISTPPNALAYATGLVSSKGMAISGVILGILGMVLTYVMMMILAQCHAF